MFIVGQQRFHQPCRVGDRPLDGLRRCRGAMQSIRLHASSGTSWKNKKLTKAIADAEQS